MSAAGFRTRQIAAHQKTLGDRLKGARLVKKVSISQAEEATHIRSKWLLALESDAWEVLPSEVYGRGYLFQYADYLGLSRKSIVEQYERERQLLSQRCRRARESAIAPQTTFRLPTFYITTRLLSYFASAAVILVLGGYLVWQVNRFSAVPLLEIAQPVAARGDSLSGVVVSGSSITVTGQTTVGANVTVNNQSVLVDGDGIFRAPVELARGENLIHIKASNRSGAARQEVLRIIAQY